MKKKVLAIVFNDFEEIELLTPVDIMRRGGIDVIIATTENSQTIKGRNGIKIVADVMLSNIQFDNFDALFIPGGPGCYALIDNQIVISLIKNFDKNQKLLCAICASPLLLYTAGALENKKFTANSCTYNTLTNALQEEDVVCDKNIITGRGPGSAIELGMKILYSLTDKKTANEVAKHAYIDIDF